MVLLTDPDAIPQGTLTTVTDLVFGTPTGATVAITSAGTNLPAIAAGEFFEIRSHSDAVNNGLYQETGGTPTTGSVTADKISGSNPIAATSESTSLLGNTGNELVIFYDTAAREAYLVKQRTLTDDGVDAQAIYSRMMIDWKDDSYLIANAPFPMLTIDADAGKYFIGQDASGNNNGWRWRDVSGVGINTRKLIRSGGWTETDGDGVTLQVYAGINTLGAFEDPGNDLAYYFPGNDAKVDNGIDFDFAGPVNEAVLVYDATVTRAVVTPNGFAFVDGGGGDDSITRADGGNFITDGYVVGGQVEVTAATTGANDGTFLITSVSAGALGVATATVTADTDDNTVTLAIDNRNRISLRLRVRDGDPNGKTFGSADLASAGETVLSNRLFKFGLANAADLKISETDANIDTIGPYTGMTLTVHATPQSLGGSGVLVGGPYNFGFEIDANNGTDIQVYEWIQRQLRKATDIDNDANDPVIGKMLDGLMRFLGDALEAGSTDGGLTFPVNPDGGGSGVFIDNLNAASKNTTTMFDNTGTSRGFPIGTTVTLDFNATLIADSLAEYTLFFDFTIRTVVSDLVVTAGTGANGTFVSAGANLAAALDAGVGSYVRVSGMTGGDAAMNGIYQVTAITSASLYSVTRYDSATIVTTAATASDVDEHPFDSPDALIVQDNTPVDVQGLASSDFVFTFDYSNNVQGGRTAATDAQVRGKAIGQSTAQYTESTIQVIESGVALTIPFTSQQERNFSNP